MKREEGKGERRGRGGREGGREGREGKEGREERERIERIPPVGLQLGHLVPERRIRISLYIHLH